MEIESLRKNLQNISKMGWIASKRRGNTGIGYTLETLLNIRENNLKTPDFGNIELKSQRKDASNRVTMFTFNRAVWKINQKDVVEKFGYIDSTGRKALYCTVNTRPNKQGLYLEINDKSLELWHTDIIAEWKIENLVRTFKEKMPAVVIVIADSRINSQNREEFYFNEAYYLKNPDIDNFIDLIKKDIIIVDIRMHIKRNGVIRNHGTGFRIEEKFLYLCFAEKEKLI